jgi:hypothetical protein
MMQSVALTDSCQHDEDFVIVEALESEASYGTNTIPAYVYDDNDDDDDYDDLASYDYCEDAYSEPETLTFQHDFLDYPLSYNLNQEGTTNSNSSACVPKILSSGISLFSYGEANSSDEAEGDSVKGSTSIAASEISTSTREEGGGGEKERSRRNDQYSDAAPSASSESDSHSLRYADTAPFAPMTHMSTKREESSRASSGSSSSSVVSSNTYQKTQSVGDDSSVQSTSSKTSQSRVSNKKRRKQLKLAKKAAAAATAAAALSAHNNRHKKSPTRKNPMAVRSSNKKQVACATQGLASYREEVIRNNKKLR